MDTTKDVIAAMLTENTGAHFLDSGGHYGRHWERNQGRDFEAEPYATIEVGTFKAQGDDQRQLELWPVVSAYHWLTERLDYAADWQARFDAFAADRDDTHWLEDMEAFAESLGADWQCVNTYNDECALSQTLQFIVVNPEGDCEALDGDTIVMLQIHGGCDMRGGYTAPKLFRGGGYDDDYGIMDYGQPWLSFRCEMPEAMQGRQAALPGVPTVYPEVNWCYEYDGNWQDDSAGYGRLHDYPASVDPADRGKGKTYVDEAAKVAYCPITGVELAVC